MWRDLKYGLRQLGGKKLFAFTVILLLALGIGANTAIFSFVNSLLFRSLPVRAPQNLYLLEKNRVRQVRPDTSFFYRQFEAVNQDKSVFTAAVAEQAWLENSFQVFSTGDTARVIATQIVSANYFSELGVSAVAGRVLTAADANESANIPAVLSYQFWSSQFHRSSGILNHTIRVKNYPFVVVGVLPREFHGIEADRVPDVRFPISAARALTGAPISEIARWRPFDSLSNPGSRRARYLLQPRRRCHSSGAGLNGRTVMARLACTKSAGFSFATAKLHRLGTLLPRCARSRKPRHLRIAGPLLARDPAPDGRSCAIAAWSLRQCGRAASRKIRRA